MCTEITIDGETYETVGELRAVLGVANVICDTLGERASDEQCLCCLAVESTAKKAGYIAKHEITGYKFTKQT